MPKFIIGDKTDSFLLRNILGKFHF
jgi:hypothetical protein